MDYRYILMFNVFSSLVLIRKWMIKVPNSLKCHRKDNYVVSRDFRINLHDLSFG